MIRRWKRLDGLDRMAVVVIGMFLLVVVVAITGAIASGPMLRYTIHIVTP